MKTLITAFSKNLLVQISLVLVTVISTPLYYRYIEQTQLSLILIVIELSYFLQSFDFGLSNSLIRLITINRENNLKWHAIYKNGRQQIYISALIVSIVLIFITLAVSLIYVLDSKVIVFIFLIICTIGISIGAYAQTGLLRVFYKYNILTTSSLVSSLAFLIVLSLSLHHGYGVVGIGASFFIRSFSYFVLNLISERRLTGVIKDYLLDINDTVSVFQSAKLMVFSISYTLFHQMDSLLAGLLIDINIVPLFVANKRFFDFAKSALDALIAVSYPRIVERDNSMNRNVIFDREQVFLLAVPVFFYTVASVANLFLIQLWIPTSASFGIYFAIAMSLLGLLNYYSYFLKTILSARGYFGKSAVISFIELIAKIAFAYICFLISWVNIYSLPILSVSALIVGFVYSYFQFKGLRGLNVKTQF